MKLINTGSFVSMVLLVLVGWFGPSSVTLSQQATLDFLGEVDDQAHPDGYRDYVEMGCWQCHGFQGKGGEDGPGLAPDPLPYESFATLTRKPANVMPAYSLDILSDARLRRIYNYLQAIPPLPEVSSIPLLSGELLHR